MFMLQINTNLESPRMFYSRQGMKIVCIDSPKHDCLVELDTMDSEVNFFE